jgi:PEP-CTERM motif
LQVEVYTYYGSFFRINNLECYMPKKIVFTICGVLILALSVMLNNAHAIPFEGEVWLAHHSDTQDYFLLFDTETVIQQDTVKLNGLKIETSSKDIDFSEITKLEEPLFFEIVDYRVKNNLKAIFSDISGNKYQVAVKIKDFQNPPGGGSIPTPEPATILLLGCGLLGLAGIGRKKFKKIK